MLATKFMVRIEYDRLQLFHVYACKFHNINITRDGRHELLCIDFYFSLCSISYVILPTEERNVKYRRELKNE